jgi:SHS2 domain-containing protein
MPPQANQENDQSGHRQLEHTADLALELWGPSEEALLREGLFALVAILTDGATIPRQHDREVELEALDPEDRLVRWLNELLYMATVSGFVPADAELTLTGRGLRAVIVGTSDGHALLTTEIKSATYHGVAVVHERDRVTARVILDV